MVISSALILPVQGTLTQYFDTPTNYIQGRIKHEALDIVTNGSQPIRAIVPGRISKIIDLYDESKKTGFGNEVWIEYESGIIGRFCHLAKNIPVSFGTTIQQNEILGMTGRTGYRLPFTVWHTHYEEYFDRRRIDPLSSPNQQYQKTMDELKKQIADLKIYIDQQLQYLEKRFVNKLIHRSTKKQTKKTIKKVLKKSKKNKQ